MSYLGNDPNPGNNAGSKSVIDIGGAKVRSASVQIGDVDPIDRDHQHRVELIIVIFVLLVAAVGVGYILIGTDEKRQEHLAGITIAIVSALLGYIAGKKSA